MYVAMLIGSLPKFFYLVWSQYDVPGGINESLEGLILNSLITVIPVVIIALLAFASESLFGLKFGRWILVIFAFTIGLALSFL